VTSPHDQNIHGHADERDPPTGSPALVMTLGAVVFVLICLFLIGVERSWHDAVLHELDQDHPAISAGGQSRLRQEAQLQAGTHAFPKGDPNEAMNGKHHMSITDAIDKTIQKYGKKQ
jgi:hypothetical protein